jgi:hypothetical protein
MVVGVFAGSIVLASPANAQPEVSSLVIGEGQLVSRGVAADLPVTIVCTGTIESLTVEVSQRVSQSRVAFGSGFLDQPVACTGTEQTITIRAQTISTAFKNGIALATASAGVCDEAGNCTFPSTTSEIRLRK